MLTLELLEEVTEEVTIAPAISPLDDELILERGVAEAAAVLDEHIPGWYDRITEPLEMDDLDLCVLGQVFDRSFPGLSGYGNGLAFLREIGFRPTAGVFSAWLARPVWDREIQRRRRSAEAGTS